MNENNLINWIAERANTRDSRLRCGIGDDAAVLRDPQSDLVVTTDLIADGTHFDGHQASPQQIGRKAMAVNLSDVAAMAAKPLCAFISLLLPSGCSQSYAQTILQSMVDFAEEFDCPVAGGDTNSWDGKLAINVTVIGQVTDRGPLLRSSAAAGDYLLVTGTLGGSIAGHHLDFTPRIKEALLLSAQYDVHAGMDLSDGLATDLRRMCAQSGCGAEVQIDNLPVSNAASQMSSTRAEAVLRALGDGEDFELLLAVPEEEAKRMLREQPCDVPITHIGVCMPGAELWQSSGNRRSKLPNIGYQHGQQSE